MRHANLATLPSILALGGSLLTSCVGAQNTPAQTLAFERWYACNHFATIRLDRIQLNGQIVATGNEYEAAPFADCIQRMAALQARQGATVGPDSATVISVEGVNIRGNGNGRR